MAAADRTQYLRHLAGEESSPGLSSEFDERFHLPTCDIPETIKIAGGGRRSLVLALETLPPRFCDTAKEGFSLLKPGLLHPREGHAGAVLICERN
jgi:hypothetical protein